MISLSTLSVIFWALVALGVGYFVGQFFTKKTIKSRNEEYHALNKEHKQLIKKEKKALKDFGKAKGQAENWRQKFETLEGDYQTEMEVFKSKQDELQTHLAKATEERNTFESENKIIASDKDRLEARLKKMEEKYSNDLEGLKEWKADKNKYERYVKDYKTKLKTTEEQLAKINTAYKKQSKELEDAKVFDSKLRGLKARNKQLENDLAYWEKKHYDTHHELTAMKDSYTSFEKKYADLELQKQTLFQQNQTMTQKVQEFKTRFVEANQEYHKLIEKTKTFGKSN